MSSRALSLWAPVVLYMAVIFWLSSIANLPSLPVSLPIPDKAAHTVLYAGLGALVSRALARGWRVTTWRTVLIAVAVGTLYGISDEFHQYFVPPRQVEVLDAVADAVGAAIGGGALYAWTAFVDSKRRQGIIR